MYGAIFYLARRFLYRIGTFAQHWYVKSGRVYANFILNRLEKIDYYFAWRITLRNLFQPLYKDYSLIGYAMGFVFRLFRLAAASVVYLFIFTIAFGLYVLWLLVPPILILGIIAG